MKKVMILFVLILFLLSVKNVLAEIKINEVFFDPEGTDTGKEWIELYNNGNNNVDISGYELNATSGDYFQFPNNTIIPPYEFILVWWRKDGGNTSNEFFTTTNGFTSNIGNSYGWVALFKNSEHNSKTAKNSIVDYIEYGKAGLTWEGAAFDAGIWQRGDFITINKIEDTSIGRKIDGADQNNPADWQEFSSPTPLQSNSGQQSTPTPTTNPTPTPSPTPTPPQPSSGQATPTPTPTPQTTTTPTPPQPSSGQATPTPTPQNSPTTTPNPSITITPTPATKPNPTPSVAAQTPLNNQNNIPVPSDSLQIILATSSQKISSDEEKLITNPEEIKKIKNNQKGLANSLIFQPINAIINLIKAIKQFILGLIK